MKIRAGIDNHRAMYSKLVHILALLASAGLLAYPQVANRVNTVPVVATEFTQYGFYPKAMTVPAGRFRLHVRNMSGKGPHTLQFRAGGGGPERQVVLSRAGNPGTSWKEDMTLTPGVYVLTAPGVAGRANRVFTLTVR